MAKRNTSTERILTGQEDLDRRLNLFGQAEANRVARAGLLKGARLAAKLIKRQVPAKYKGIRAAIGSSVKKTRAGVTKAKAGAAVGKAAKVKPYKRSSEGGVGISAENVHWFLMGTDERQTSANRATGEMPAFPAVRKAMSGGQADVVAAIREGMLAAFKKATAILARKRSR